MTPLEDYRQLLTTALRLGKRNCDELVRLKVACTAALASLKYGNNSKKAIELLEKAMSDE